MNADNQSTSVHEGNVVATTSLHPLDSTVLPARLVALAVLCHATASGTVALSYVRPLIGHGMAAYDDVGYTRVETTALLFSTIASTLAELMIAWLAFEYAARVRGLDGSGEIDSERRVRRTLRFWFWGVVAAELLIVAASGSMSFVPGGNG